MGRALREPFGTVLSRLDDRRSLAHVHRLAVAEIELLGLCTRRLHVDLGAVGEPQLDPHLEAEMHHALGPHGIPLVEHARAGGVDARAVLELLEATEASV